MTDTKPDQPSIKVGDTVRLHFRIREGKKDRIQVFEGMILSLAGKTPATRTITVRKEYKGYGVEKIIPLALPALTATEVVKTAAVRRKRLYYLRNYQKRLQETVVKK